MRKIKYMLMCGILIGGLGVNYPVMAADAKNISEKVEQEKLDTNLSTDSKLVYVNPMTKEERAQEHIRQIKEYCKKLNISDDENYIVSYENGDIVPLNDIGDYKTTYAEAKEKVFSEYAANQPTKGTKFSTGGGFYYSPDGGNCKFDVAIGGAYGVISVSIPIGKVTTSTTGYFVTVPTTTSYYKLKVNKKYEIQAYAIYHKEWNDQTMSYYWRKVSVNHSKIFISQEFITVRV